MCFTKKKNVYCYLTHCEETKMHYVISHLNQVLLISCAYYCLLWRCRSAGLYDNMTGEVGLQLLSKSNSGLGKVKPRSKIINKLVVACNGIA